MADARCPFAGSEVVPSRRWGLGPDRACAPPNPVLFHVKHATGGHRYVSRETAALNTGAQLSARSNKVPPRLYRIEERAGSRRLVAVGSDWHHRRLAMRPPPPITGGPAAIQPATRPGSGCPNTARAGQWWTAGSPCRPPPQEPTIVWAPQRRLIPFECSLVEHARPMHGGGAQR